MDINIYGTYEVTHICRGSDIDTENSEPNDVVFKDFRYNDTKSVNGGNLINDIKNRLDDVCFQSLFINSDTNSIIIEHFNYNTGEICTYKWVIEEIKNEEIKNN